MRILVIDDDPDYVNETCGLLTDEGYDAVGACAVEEAERILSQQGHDLSIALVDMYIDIDDEAGLRLVQHMRAMHPGIVPIVVTGHGNLENAAKCMKAGAFHYIVKEVTPDELLFQVIALAVAYHRMLEGVERLSTQMTGVFEALEVLQRLREDVWLADLSSR
jgi:DNA-binding NtrC family response regulator